MGIECQGDVRVSWPQADGAREYQLYGGAEGGAVDYDRPLTPRPIPAFPDGESDDGFGVGAFGLEAFGDGEGVGFGIEAFGVGPFGLDACELSVDLRRLSDGAHAIAVVPRDAAGNEAAPAAGTALVLVAATPRPPTLLRAGSLAGGRLALTFALSPDDEA